MTIELTLKNFCTAYLETKAGEAGGQVMQLQKKVEHLGRQLERQANHIDTIVDRSKCELLGKLGQKNPCH